MIGRGSWRRRPVDCTGCGAGWHAPARYCGRCGQPLVPRTPRPRPDAPAARRAVGSGLVVAVAVAALAASGVDPRRPTPAPADVALPDAGVVPSGEGLRGQEAQAALAPFHPDRLRCQPEGCERWRLPGPVTPVTPARIGDDLVIAFDDHLTSVEAATGTVRWTIPLHEVQPHPQTRWWLRAAELRLTATDGQLLTWSPRGFLQLRDAEGQRRWSVTLPETRRLWSAQPAGDVIVVASAEHTSDGPAELLRGFDRTDGRQRWETPVRWVYANDPHGPVVRTEDDDRPAIIDPVTGGVTAHLDVRAPQWVRPHGPFLVATTGNRSVTLLDRRTGEAIGAADGVADVGTATAELAALLVAERNGDGSRTARVVAIAADGRARWTHELGTFDPPDRCCPSLAAAPDGTVAARLVNGGPVVVLDAEDGTALEGPTFGGPSRWLARDLLYTEDGDGAAVVAPDGATITLSGTRIGVASVDPLVVATREGVLGLDRSVADPALAPPPEQRPTERSTDTVAAGNARPSAPAAMTQ